jgi:hypothetical protein
MVNKYALIKDGVVQNIIVSGPEFLEIIADQYDAIIDYTKHEEIIAIGHSYDSNSNKFKPSELTSEQKLELIEKKMSYGEDLIKAITLYSTELDPVQEEELINAMTGVMKLLQLGLLAQANKKLDSTVGVNVLDDPYDLLNPTGGTVKEHLSKSILAGDTQNN